MSTPLINAMLTEVPTPPIATQTIYIVLAWNATGHYWKVHDQPWASVEIARIAASKLPSIWLHRRIAELKMPGIQL